MIAWTVVPTARIASDEKKYTSIAPMSAAMNTSTLARLTEVRSWRPALVPASIWRPMIRLTLSM